MGTVFRLQKMRIIGFMKFFAKSMLVFLLLLQSIFAQEKAIHDEYLTILRQQPFVIIPIGGDCQFPMHLRDHGLYLASFPIDWVVTYHLPSLLALIENDFEDLVNFSLLQINSDSGTPRVLHQQYEIELPHIINTANWHNSKYGLMPNSLNKEEITAIVNKYKRRIERFKKVVCFSVPIYFVRYGIMENEALEICDLLERKFPLCNFKLLCIENHNRRNEKWKQHPRIIHEYLNPEYDLNQRLHGPRHPAFTRLFVKLGWL